MAKARAAKTSAKAKKICVFRECKNFLLILPEWGFRRILEECIGHVTVIEGSIAKFSLKYFALNSF